MEGANIKRSVARLVLACLCPFFSFSWVTANGQTAPAQGAPPTRFGILYTGWHCLVVQPNRPPPFNIAEALAGKRPWGPIPAFHFWTEPKEGYYCLTDRPDILRRHAEMLRDAGIDFIVFDATNNEFADRRTPDSPKAIVEPFRKLLEIWLTVPGAPKVVPWAPLTAKGDMLEWMMAELSAFPALRFIYEGKPLALVTQNVKFETDESKAADLARSSTVRRMWSRIRQPEQWSFLSECQKGFRESVGQRHCDQPTTRRNGSIEQISISTAYQETYISLKATAVPKFHGRTFVRQFQALIDAPATPIALITGWNEWMAQRLCVDPSRRPEARGCTLDNDHWPDGNKIFVDQYDVEYNRDIEPSKDWPGDFYYRLMAHCISRFRAQRSCSEADVFLPDYRP